MNFTPTHFVTGGEHVPLGTPVMWLQKSLIRGTSRVVTEQGLSFIIPQNFLERMCNMSNVIPVSQPGKMSGDRVHFTVPARQLLKSSYIQLLTECFGIKQGEYDNHQDLEVVCRPSQFARFIILRHTKHKESNEMSALNMRLVSPVPPKRENKIDCSARANHAVGEAAA